MKIGVFDSGIGGKSVAQAIELALPEHQIIFRDDSEHIPYGTKSLDEIRNYATPILQDMANVCDVIVVACNTVSTNLIDELRLLVAVPLIATEPMVKSAVDRTETKIIAICATPRTLTSTRYLWLKEKYAAGVKVLEPDCSEWTSLIEANQMNQNLIEKDIDALCQAGADVIVLGCTHYHWIEQEVSLAANGRAEVLQPEPVIIDELKQVLSRLQ
jgi:glutamate racemase